MATRIVDDLVPVPRSAVRFPLELPLPAGFVVDRVDTWPVVDGELEFVAGRLLYMPPSADRQQDTSADVVTALGAWRKLHPEFVLGGNEAGMILGDEARAADAAVWRASDLGPYRGKFRRVPPVLAVEVQGEFDETDALRAKAAWYLARGVHVVWLLMPADRRVTVVTATAEVTCGVGERLPAHPALPALEPRVDELFEQVLHAPMESP